MAFNFTTLAPTRIAAVGSYTQMMIGITTLVGGAIDVTIPGITRIRAAGAESNSSTNVAYVSATSGATLTITGNGTDQVTWWALVDGGV